MGRSAASLDAGSLEKEKGILKNDAIDVIQAHGKNDNDTGWQGDSGNQGVGAPHIRDRAYWVADADNRGKLPLLRAEQNDSTQALRRSEADKLGRCLAGGDKSELIGMANAGLPQREPQQDFGASSIFRAAIQQEERRDVPNNMGAALNSTSEPGPTNGFWRDVDWLFCRDGKWRPVEPGTSPLVDGAAQRVGRLRGYGNAINAEAAKAFITAFMEAA